jgi:hypothetical protein
MNHEPATPATDIAMGARCMLALMDRGASARQARHAGHAGHAGYADDARHSDQARRRLASFFRGCCLSSPRGRPKDAWALLREFDDLIARLWGERRFHQFAVPAACPR